MIDSDRVALIYSNCLFENHQDTEDKIFVEGIIHDVEFDSKLLNDFKNEIETMLNELPDEFKETSGGGFLNACNDKHGNQWTGLHFRMEQLFSLGIAIKKVKYLMPKNMWKMFPGEIPYLVVLD